MTPAHAAKSLVHREALIADKIPYAYLLDAETVETKSGNLLQVIKVDGLFAETMDDRQIDFEKQLRNTLWRSVADSSFAIYYHIIRRKEVRQLEGIYPTAFSKKLHDKWQAKFSDKTFYVNELYITVVKKPPTGKIRRFADLFAALSSRVNHDARMRFRKKAHKDLTKVTHKIMSNLAHYGAVKLSTRVDNSWVDNPRIDGLRADNAGSSDTQVADLRISDDQTEGETGQAGRGDIKKQNKQNAQNKQNKQNKKSQQNVISSSLPPLSSEVLSFLSELINLEKRNVIAPKCDLASYLPYKRLFFDAHSGTIAIRDIKNHSAYAALLSIKDYDTETYAGMLDHLLDIPAEMIITQTFSFLDKGLARRRIEEQQRNLAQSDDGLNSQSMTIGETLDELGSGVTVTGEHYFSVLCKADSLESLDKCVSQVDAAFSEIGIVAVREDIGLKAAFFAMLPANLSYQARRPILSSKNIASFASLHNYPQGKFSGNYWGEAVTVLETISGTPYYFNFHVLDVANTMIIGPMGSGKTLLEAFLLSESMKYGGRLIALDLDRGLELFIRAQEGLYSTLSAGQRTGFAPFQMDDTVSNRYFLTRLMRMIAVAQCKTLFSLSDDDEARINTAVNGAFQLTKDARILRNIVPFLGMRKAGSLRSRFDAWVDDGDYAWVFDNDKDHLSMDYQFIGFDMSEVLKDPIISSPVYFYLFNRIEQQLDGTKTRIVVAEGWRALDDKVFRDQLQAWSSTPRKKEAFLVFDTQSPHEIAESPIGCKLAQESVTKIFFANPEGKYEHYVEKLGLSTKEFEIIKNLDKSSRFFLLKQGKQSAVVRADLTASSSLSFDDDIAILSGRTKTVKLLDKIREKVGDNASDWMPLFLKAIHDAKIKCDTV